LPGAPSVNPSQPGQPLKLSSLLPLRLLTNASGFSSSRKLFHFCSSTTLPTWYGPSHFMWTTNRLFQLQIIPKLLNRRNTFDSVNTAYAMPFAKIMHLPVYGAFGALPSLTLRIISRSFYLIPKLEFLGSRVSSSTSPPLRLISRPKCRNSPARSLTMELLPSSTTSI